MHDLELHVTKLKKIFNRRIIFRDISFTICSGQTLLITGRNGSGKSTLVKIISNILTPTEGNVEFVSPSGPCPVLPQSLIGLVSPYLQLYEEFSARENLQLALAIRGMAPDDSAIDSLLERLSLRPRMGDHVQTFSSGMKQRAKLAMAMIHQPPILILDEPMSNLDEDGIRSVREIMAEHKTNGLLVVATNDLTDLDSFDIQVDLNAPH
ncbi:MAG: ABC-type multidrug transport system ATPase component [Bacteroidetes bacterium]|nr:ABC-type multidrug transport system ATPase component [Bacteroidota bacterium]